MLLPLLLLFDAAAVAVACTKTKWVFLVERITQGTENPQPKIQNTLRSRPCSCSGRSLFTSRSED